MASPYPPLDPPPTPIMLYIGAGYDLSPLLTFAPGGSPYPIAPLPEKNRGRRKGRGTGGLEHDASLCAEETYTSFIFVDAKPRHTSAFMVPDFDEWKGLDARVRNVLHYSQGILTRWRTVPGAPDLIWFEGGGDDEFVRWRADDEDWSHDTMTTWQHHSSSSRPSMSRSHLTTRPLTTLLYLFNTLDIELTRAPLMENMWSRVHALYVHGLRIHHQTGAGMAMVRDQTDDAVPGAASGAGLGRGLKRCYVLVGSWGGRTGVNKVDFVREARRRSALRVGLSSSSSSRLSSASTSASASTLVSASVSSLSIPYSTLPSPPSISVSSASLSYPHVVASSSSSTFSIPTFQASSSSSTCLSYSSNPNFIPSSTTSAHPNPTSTLLHSFHALSDSFYFNADTETNADADTHYFTDLDLHAEVDLQPTHPHSPPFHIPLPQLGYSPTLQRYYIARTIPECVALVKARRTGGGDVDYVGEDDNVLTQEKTSRHGWNDSIGRKEGRGRTIRQSVVGWWERVAVRTSLTLDEGFDGDRGDEMGLPAVDDADTDTEVEMEIKIAVQTNPEMTPYMKLSRKRTPSTSMASSLLSLFQGKGKGGGRLRAKTKSRALTTTAGKPTTSKLTTTGCAIITSTSTESATATATVRDVSATSKLNTTTVITETPTGFGFGDVGVDVHVDVHDVMAKPTSVSMSMSTAPVMGVGMMGTVTRPVWLNSNRRRPSTDSDVTCVGW